MINPLVDQQGFVHFGESPDHFWGTPQHPFRSRPRDGAARRRGFLSRRVPTWWACCLVFGFLAKLVCMVSSSCFGANGGQHALLLLLWTKRRARCFLVRAKWWPTLVPASFDTWVYGATNPPPPCPKKNRETSYGCVV